MGAGKVTVFSLLELDIEASEAVRHLAAHDEPLAYATSRTDLCMGIGIADNLSGTPNARPGLMSDIWFNHGQKVVIGVPQL